MHKEDQMSFLRKTQPDLFPEHLLSLGYAKSGLRTLADAQPRLSCHACVTQTNLVWVTHFGGCEPRLGKFGLQLGADKSDGLRT